MHDEGGDAACWVDAVCDRCGALIDVAEPHRCRDPADTTTAGRRTQEPSEDDRRFSDTR